MRQSPFYDETLIEKSIDSKGKKREKRPTIRLPIETYNRLNEYFEANNLDFSKGLRSFCYEKLDTICNERKTFNNLECFMLIPKAKVKFNTNSSMEDDHENFFHILNTHSEIIAIVNTDVDFRRNYHHVNSFDDNYNLAYELKDFSAENFPLSMFQNTKETCVYRTNTKTLRSFYALKDRLSSIFYDLNVDDCYFVHFPLNNYLDVFREGQYHHETFSNMHEGIYVFQDFEKPIKHYCSISWSYSYESKGISLEFEFYDKDNFMNDIYETKDMDLINAASEIIDSDFIKNKLMKYKEKLLKELDYVELFLASEDDD